MFRGLGLFFSVLLVLQGPAAAQMLKGLLDKSGASAPAMGAGSVNQGQVDSLSDKVAACNQLDTQGMIKCATALGPMAADFTSQAAGSGVLGPQVRDLSAAISSMSQGTRVSTK
jgi:hypothetical protein